MKTIAMKHSFLLLAVLGLIPFFPSALAETAKPTVLIEHWMGEYFYPKNSTQKKPVAFELTLTKVGKKIRGKMAEPNTFGENGFDKLFANVKGTISNSGKVSFKKTYDGTAGVKHSVQYIGIISKDKASVLGTWHIKDISGDFKMTKVAETNPQAAPQ